MEIPILRHTRHFTIVNKPPLVYSQVNRSAVTSQRTNGLPRHEQSSLLDLIVKGHRDLFPENPEAPFTRPKLVHRLDYGVTGAMVVATSLQAARNFSKSLKLRGDKGWPMKKIYLAIVAPQPESPLRQRRITSDPAEGIALDTDGLSGTISRPLFYDKLTDPLETVTKFEVLNVLDKGRVLLALEPVTGRKHQLRRHCADVLKAPIIGDVRYGYNFGHLKSGCASRCIALHSWRLDFKAGLHWDCVTAPILWGVSDLWAGVVDPATNDLYPNMQPTALHTAHGETVGVRTGGG
ncbi:pseudouridine synthase [Lipomyces tetrasporus]|uniref:21S rRNA pseudouridine(2819) synthase n=1 Tax=Lipomyces tetrasporus TaxID=54092 RepID=A0AAD7QRZ3_9ASCO|nr:pseudouridine synthase [Lipomyces tetrasporus]KAJ8100319.1 pseudouridine synthase [Lipomyces tetrasporus]